jgi:SAM-dependent methyltransferase
MSEKEVISAVKYVSRMKPEFMLSEIVDYVKGSVSTAEIYRIVAPLASGMGLGLERSGDDYAASRIVPAKAMALGEKERAALDELLMSPHIPAELEKLIKGYVEKKTGKAWDDPAVLDKVRKAIVAQKAQYWKEGPKRKITYETGYSILGYLAYQFPVYFIQTEHIFYELALDGLLKDRMNVLDVGTGPGTVPLALIDFYRKAGCGEAIVYSVEKYEENIEAFMALVPAYAEGTRVKVEKPIKADMLGIKMEDLPGDIDLIVFSNVLNELGHDIEKKIDVVKTLSERLAKDGSIVIVEPADKVNSTQMRQLVVALMGKGMGVFSPCSFIWGVRCHPETCWTFQAKADIRPTTMMKKLAEEEYFRYLNTDIKYSYAVLRHDRLSKVTYRVPEKAKFARLSRMKDHVEKHINVAAAVMSGELGDEKDHVFRICDGTSVKPVYAILPAYHVSPENEALLKAKYGQVVEIYGTLARYNKENDAYNLLIMRNTKVEPV